jgi:osmoprotectant transport system permease protein
VIGTATLSTPVGQTSLGNYIFTGLQTQNWVFVLFGCAAAALLALAVDQLLALMEDGVRSRGRTRLALGGLGLALVFLAALVPGLARPHAAYVVGAKTFTEQYILAALIEQRLQAAGLTATRREGLGSNLIFDALASGEIDVYVDYSGTLWANELHRTDIAPRAQVLADLRAWLQERYRIGVLGELGFENAYALAMTRGRAQALGIRSIADLARHASGLTIAGDYEFFARPEWAAVRKAYGLTFRAQREMQPEFMYPALTSGDVDVITAYTSDGRIAEYDLAVLEDPLHAIPPYDAMVLIAPKRADDHALADALKPLVGAIDVDLMRAANLRATKGTAEAAADQVARWLWGEIEKRKAAPSK